MIKFLKEEKEKLEAEIESLTLAELLRNELWDDKTVEIAAWKREHPSKHAILVLHTKGKGAKKVLLECISRLQKQNEKILDEFKNTK